MAFPRKQRCAMTRMRSRPRSGICGSLSQSLRAMRGWQVAHERVNQALRDASYARRCHMGAASDASSRDAAPATPTGCAHATRSANTATRQSNVRRCSLATPQLTSARQVHDFRRRIVGPRFAIRAPSVTVAAGSVRAGVWVADVHRRRHGAPGQDATICAAGEEGKATAGPTAGIHGSHVAAEQRTARASRNLVCIQR
jgi:hypothetical protein